MSTKGVWGTASDERDKRQAHRAPWKSHRIQDLRCPSSSSRVALSLTRTTATPGIQWYPSPLSRFRASGVVYGGMREWVWRARPRGVSRGVNRSLRVSGATERRQLRRSPGLAPGSPQSESARAKEVDGGKESRWAGQRVEVAAGFLGVLCVVMV